MAGKFSVEAIFRAVDKFSRPIQRMENRTKRFTRSLGRAVSGVGSMAKGAIGALMSVKVHAALAAGAIGLVARHVVTTGMGYEAAIAAVGAVSLKTINQIAELDAKAQELGRTTKFTATEAANGMELMARAGFDTKDILAGIDGVLAAAAASGMDLAETTDHVSNVLKGMGLAASETTRVADVLTLASSKTNSTIGSLGESMRNVSATARQLNIPLEDVVAAVASLQDVGLDASVAGSALNTMLTKLAKPTSEVAAKMKKWGVAFKDAHGNMLPLPIVLENMAKAAQKSGGNMDQVAFFADLVGLRGQKAASNLKDLFMSGKFSTLAEELRNAEGAAKKMADLRMDNLQGDVELFKSAVAGLEIQLYKLKGGPLRGIVKGMTEWIGANDKLIGQNVGDVLNALRPLSKVVQSIADSVDGVDVEDLISQFQQFVAIFSDSFVEAFNGVQSGLKSMSDAMAALGMHGGTNDLMGDLAKNLGILAAVAAGAVIVFGKLVFAIAAIGTAIMSGLKSAFGAIVKDIGGLVAAFVTTFDNIKAIFDTQNLTLGQKMLAIAKALIKGFVEGIKNGAKLVWDTATGFGKNFLDGVKKSLGVQSPSREMAKLGRQSGKGFEVGLKRSEPGITEALRRITELPEMAPANVQAPVVVPPPRLRIVGSSKWDRDEEQQDEQAGGGSKGGGPDFRPVPNLGAAAVSRSIQETLSSETVTLRVVGDTKQVQLDNKPKSGRVTIELPKSGTFG